MLKQAILTVSRKRLFVLAMLILSLCAVLTTSVGTQEAQARICCSACYVENPPLACNAGCSDRC